MRNRKSTASLSIESLESRQLMSAPTELSQLAAEYPVHNGQSNLYLNFDGGNISDHQGSANVTAYQSDPGVDRDQMIRDIVYRVSEIFSPFNVRVRVMHGAGNYSKSNGDSTIFIGDDASNTDGGFDIAYSHVSWNSADYPGLANGYLHAPNSNAYDLGFVDPIFYSPQPNALRSQSALTIARDIAHEAGHTFGLAHDLSSPLQDVMSYDASNTAFQDTVLNITDSNNSGSSTGTTDYAWPMIFTGNFFPTIQKITSENTFAYLTNALGAPPLQIDSYAHSVADPTAVAGDYYAKVGNPTTINMTSHPSYVLGGAGDYDVYTMNLPSNPKAAASLTKIALTMGNLPFDPEIMAYSGDGQTLLASIHGSALQYAFQPNTNYKIVIGSYLGETTGNYTLSLSPAQMPNAPAVIVTNMPAPTPVSTSPFLTDDSAQSAMAALLA